MSSYVSDYTFNGMSRIGNDNALLDQTAIQNTLACNYLLQNYRTEDCELSKIRSFATSQPGIIYAGGHGGLNGCNIDVSSQLSIGSIQTAPKGRIDLFARPFATVPFLGRGAVDPVVEAQILQGESSTNRRSVNRLAEKSHIKYRNTPLIPEIRSTVQNPNNLIESDAADGWIRGGMPTRDMIRDKQFYKSN